MKVKQLIEKLNELVKENPAYADIEVRWYVDVKGHIHRGDCWPIQLYYNTVTKDVRCVLNAINDPPGYGMKLVSNYGKPKTEKNV